MEMNATTGNCRSCGEPLTQRFCANCGTDSQCASCGAPLTGSFCGQCGAAVAGAATTSAAATATTKAKRAPWVIPVAIVAAIALIASLVTIAVVASGGGSSSDENAIVDVSVAPESTTTVAPTTTAAPTTTLPPTTVPVSCPADPNSLMAALAKGGFSNASTLSHMGVASGSSKFVMANKYIYFRLVPIDQMGSQGGGIFMRCDGGSWTFLGVVDGYSCDPKWVGQDADAAKAFGIC